METLLLKGNMDRRAEGAGGGQVGLIYYVKKGK
jgi:hypothetical protein